MLVTQIPSGGGGSGCHSSPSECLRSVNVGSRMNRRRAEDFELSGAILCDARIVGTCPHGLMTTRGMDSLKREPWCQLQTLGDNDVSMSVHRL